MTPKRLIQLALLAGIATVLCRALADVYPDVIAPPDSMIHRWSLVVVILVAVVWIGAWGLWQWWIDRR